MKFFSLAKEIRYLRKENCRLRDLCEEKDILFKKLMSDGLRHGSKLSAQHMIDRKNYLHGK